MVGPAVDCLRNPLGAVRTLFEKECAQCVPVAGSRSDWGVKQLFDNYLHMQGGFLHVPEINSAPLSAIPVNSLVRFRGIVQDMFDVEYYLGAYKDGVTWRTAKFSDVVDYVPEQCETMVWERRLLYCVPVPGESDWVKDAFASHWRASADEPLLHASSQSEKKRREPEDVCDVVDMDDDCGGVVKRSKVDSAATTSNLGGGDGAISQSSNSNAAILNSSLVPCIVKVYDGADSEIKLNDIVEFTGILTFDPELSSSSTRGGDGAEDDSISLFMEENICSQLPSSRVPRLHCLTFRKLPSHTIVKEFPIVEEKDASLMETSETMAQLRASLMDGLTSVLGGDRLAAEYLLLHALSQVHHRVDSMALGKFSLNIVTGNARSGELASSPVASAVAGAMEALLPCSRLIPLTLHNLNDALMAPHKDYTTNRLVTGALQLAEGTYLTLDETSLSTGQLNSIGIQNIQSLKYLMEWQKVEYDFQYYKLDMPTDVPVLVISHAKSRLLPADVVVPIRAGAEVSSAFLSDDSEIRKWRLFLSSVRNLDHSLEPSMQASLESELVEARKHDRSLTTDTFHRWLTLARLLSISYGERTLSLERWLRIREMEQLCAERLRTP